MHSDITGIILAGGQSKRMGFSKAFVRFNGKPLIDHALLTLKEITPNVILSVGTNPIEYKNLPVVKDIYPDRGPMGGIYSALLHSETDLNLVLSCDMPFIPAGLLQLLVEEAREHQADVTLPADEHGYWQTLCAVYRKSLLSRMRDAVVEDKLKLKTFLAEVNSTIIPLNEGHKYYRTNAFLNMNTPEMIHEAEKQWIST